MRFLRCPEGSCERDCRECPGIDEAANLLEDCGLVVYPTNTVYGLAAKALDLESVGRLFEAKARPMRDPVPVAVPSVEAVRLVADVDDGIIGLLAGLEDEPVTWVLPVRDDVPAILVAGGSTIGVRILPNGCAGLLSRKVGPITATSANRHGDPPPRTVEEAASSLKDSVELFIDCDRAPIGTPTTVVEVGGPEDVRGRHPSVTVIREGAISETLLNKRIASLDRGRK